jgi:hypothetical protein
MKETLEEAAVIYAHRSFIWLLNKQGEKQSIPPGQVVPSGYTKHQKIATKHFTNGAKWQQERSYSEEEVNHLEWIYNRMINVYNENENYDYMIRFKNIIKQFKKK